LYPRLGGVALLHRRPETEASGSSGRDFAKFTDRRDCRSPEALARRRSQRLDYEPGGYTWVKPQRPAVVSITPSAPKPPPPPDDLLHDAELLLDTGARVRGDTFTDEVRLRLKVSFDVATAVVNELISQRRLVRNVASNGFTTLSRPTGKAAHQKRSK
jgi:hypothetical protein